MLCPLCGRRKTKRLCPALGKEICAVCCGTKRLVEIACPSDCAYLVSAREHPAAVIARQRHRDLGLVAETMRDLSDRQLQLLLLTLRYLGSYQPSDLVRVADDDVREAVEALAATFETSSRGVIYDHRPQSLPAERLAVGLKPLMLEAGRNGGSTFEREAAVVLRRVSESVRAARKLDSDNQRSFLDWIGRILRERQEERAPAEADSARLIVP